eukprot:jgi/Chrzof1/14127/Cz08g26030.t1
MPLIACSELYFGSVYSKYHEAALIFDKSARKTISVQHYSFLPLMMVARYGLYIQSIKHVISGKIFVNRRLEVLAQLVFFTWYIALVSLLPGWNNRLIMVVLSHAAFGVLHLQICLSHFAMPCYLGTPPAHSGWISCQCAGTSNWSCPWWLDWFHGGLQYQIEHHLFPRSVVDNI